MLTVLKHLFSSAVYAAGGLGKQAFVWGGRKIVVSDLCHMLHTFHQCCLSLRPLPSGQNDLAGHSLHFLYFTSVPVPNAWNLVILKRERWAKNVYPVLRFRSASPQWCWTPQRKFRCPKGHLCQQKDCLIGTVVPLICRGNSPRPLMDAWNHGLYQTRYIVYFFSIHMYLW